MQVWFTADLHLGHGNIIKYCQRPYMTEAERAAVSRDPRGKFTLSQTTVQGHDEALLDAINSRVQVEDLLWIVGDFCMGGLAMATEYRGRIRCRNVHLVMGNHDRHSVKPVFSKVIDQGMFTFRGQDIWLNHYPMRSWNRSFHGSWHLYGHVHGQLTEEDAREDWRLTKDVGVDANDYKPVSFDDVLAYMAPRIAKFKERRNAGVIGQDEEA
jgi:calcineurin-like phosphoesterase family protein